MAVGSLFGLFRSSGRSLGVHSVDPVVSWDFPDILGPFRAFGEMKGLWGASVKDF